MEVNTFKSKADTLSYLSRQIQHANILPICKVYLSDWINDPSDVFLTIQKQFHDKTLIVRSSCSDEDTSKSSNAGSYMSVLGVRGNRNIKHAIESVFASYKNKVDEESHLLIQPQLLEIKISGVAFTRDPNNCGYYHVINYDESGDSQAITSGCSSQQSLEYWFHLSSQNQQGWKLKLLALLDELMSIYPETALDVEFAVDQNQQLYLFQTRPLLLSPMISMPSIEDNYLQIAQVNKKVKRLSNRHPHLVGDRTVFANMPDWNPAEIIGCKPKPLALSLYKEVVTDGIWAYQRTKYHYRDLRSFPLMVDLAHSPYIDTRVSFNSFIPESLSDAVAEKLVNHYIQELSTFPQLQDKVEFDIVISCFTFDLDERLSRLPEGLLTNIEKQELSAALKRLTFNVVNPQSGLLINDLKKVESLKNKQQEILSTELNKIEKIYWLIEDCKRYGTLPFAGIARAAFISKQFLDSLTNVGILSSTRVESFIRSLTTVSSKYINDLQTLDKNDFLEIYGHLRAGTYEIDSPRYDEMVEQLFSQNKQGNIIPEVFELTFEEKRAIDNLLDAKGFSIDHQQLFTFCRRAIEGRESAKFIFSKSISEVLQLIKSIGQEIGTPSNDLAYLNIKDIMSLYGSTFSASFIFQNSIERHKNHYQRCLQINLPPVILGGESIEQFKVPEAQPNFITSKQKTAQVAFYDHPELSNKIVFIPNADPGFDWLFSKNIAGLVTMYGGANSHMAIRAGEMGIPAIIGAGEMYFSLWKMAELLSVDCLNKKVDILS